MGIVRGKDVTEMYLIEKIRQAVECQREIYPRVLPKTLLLDGRRPEGVSRVIHTEFGPVNCFQSTEPVPTLVFTEGVKMQFNSFTTC